MLSVLLNKNVLPSFCFVLVPVPLLYIYNCHCAPSMSSRSKAIVGVPLNQCNTRSVCMLVWFCVETHVPLSLSVMLASVSFLLDDMTGTVFVYLMTWLEQCLSTWWHDWNSVCQQASFCQANPRRLTVLFQVMPNGWNCHAHIGHTHLTHSYIWPIHTSDPFIHLEERWSTSVLALSVYSDSWPHFGGVQ